MSFIESVKGFVAKVGFGCKKYAPQIFFGIGTACLIGGTVLAVKNTLDNKEKFDEDVSTIESIKSYAMEELAKEDSEYTKADYRGAMFKAVSDFGSDIVRAYAIPTALLGTSVFCYGKGYANLFGRVTQATNTAMLFKKYYDEHRKLTAEKIGEEAENDIRMKIETKTDEEGKTTKEAPKAYPLEGTIRFFDETSKLWDKNPDIVLQTLKLKLDYVNRILKRDGHIFLNDVLDILDLPKCKAGQYLGWIYDKNIENKISFGQYMYVPADMYEYAFSDTIQEIGYVYTGTNTIILDFNVDGNILDLAKFAA